MALHLGDVLGDGAYDTVDCLEAVYDRGGRQVIPPDKNAKLQKRGLVPALQERDQAIRRMQELGEEGRSRWKRGGWISSEISSRNVHVQT